MFDLEEIKARIKEKKAFTPAEIAYVIAHDRGARLDYMVLNNPANVNETLKFYQGNHALPFMPDQKALLATTDLLHAKNDHAEIEHIEKRFKVNTSAANETADPEVLDELKKYFSNWF